jgi:hypothetical protein
LRRTLLPKELVEAIEMDWQQAPLHLYNVFGHLETFYDSGVEVEI